MAPQLLQVTLDSDIKKSVIEGLTRAENALKAAMHQCVCHARALQSEQMVVSEARTLLDGESIVILKRS